jgi:hypothetical protein
VDVPFFDRLVTWIEDRIPPVKKPVQRLRNYLRDSKKQEEQKDICRFPED